MKASQWLRVLAASGTLTLTSLAVAYPRLAAAPPIDAAKRPHDADALLVANRSGLGTYLGKMFSRGGADESAADEETPSRSDTSQTGSAPDREPTARSTRGGTSRRAPAPRGGTSRRAPAPRGTTRRSPPSGGSRDDAGRLAAGETDSSLVGKVLGLMKKAPRRNGSLPPVTPQHETPDEPTRDFSEELNDSTHGPMLKEPQSEGAPSRSRSRHAEPALDQHEFAADQPSAKNKGEEDDSVAESESAYDDESLEISPQAKESLMRLTARLRANPTDARAWCERGKVFAQEGFLARAVQDYSAAIHSSPDLVEAYGNRGLAHEDLENYEEAINDFTRVTELRPSLAKGFYDRGRVYEALGKTVLAAADFARAAQLDPNNALAYQQLGAALLAQHHYGKAASTLTHALQLDPEHSLSYYQRGLALSLSGQYGKALFDFDEVSQPENNKARSGAYFHLANGRSASDQAAGSVAATAGEGRDDRAVAQSSRPPEKAPAAAPVELHPADSHPGELATHHSDASAGATHDEVARSGEEAIGEAPALAATGDAASDALAEGPKLSRRRAEAATTDLADPAPDRPVLALGSNGRGGRLGTEFSGAGNLRAREVPASGTNAEGSVQPSVASHDAGAEQSAPRIAMTPIPDEAGNQLGARIPPADSEHEDATEQPPQAPVEGAIAAHRRNRAAPSVPAVPQVLPDSRQGNNHVSGGSGAESAGPGDKSQREAAAICRTDGMNRIRDGQFQQAIVDFTKALRINPADAEALAGRGLAYLFQDEDARALSDLSEAIRLKDDNPLAFGHRAVVYLNTGRLEQAIADCSRALELNPDYAEAYLHRGIALAETGAIEQAVDDLSTAARLDPDSAIAHLELGRNRLKLGNSQAAVDDLSRALALAPLRAEAYRLRARALLRVNRHEDVVIDCAAALKLEPRHPEAHNLRGEAFRNLGHLDKALAEFNTALRLDPKYARAYANRGVAYMNQGYPDKALADLDRALKYNPRDAYAYLQRGKVLQYRGKVSQAIAEYTKAISCNQGYAEAYQQRGSAYLKVGQHSEAIADLTKAIELRPDSAIAHYELGKAHFSLGDEAEAVTHYDRAVELNPIYADAYYDR
jgi:tetratricopeptide (TPR) repeat protein